MPRQKKTRTASAVDAALGERLRKRRIFLELSLEALGEKLGLAWQQIQKYENGKNRISVSRLLEIAEALKVSPEYFLKGLYASDAPIPKPPSKDGIHLLRVYEGIKSARLRKQLLT